MARDTDVRPNVRTPRTRIMDKPEPPGDTESVWRDRGLDDREVDEENNQYNGEPDGPNSRPPGPLSESAADEEQ